MNKRTLFAVVLAGFVVAGCGTTGAPVPGGGRPVTPGIQPCSTNVCQIDVPVTTTTVNGHGLTTIGPVPDLEVVKGNYGPGGQGVRIVWHLTAPGYMFKDDGITFKSESAGGQFSGPGTGGAGAEFHWTDRNRDEKSYGYQIKIYNRSTGEWTTLDPTIINRG